MKKSLVRIALVTVAILLIPVLGRWPWGVGDFVIMGVLIFGTGLAMDWAVRTVEKKYRPLAILAVLGVFFVIWAQLAVGLLGKGLAGIECVANRGIDQTINCANEVRELGGE